MKPKDIPCTEKQNLLLEAQKRAAKKALIKQGVDINSRWFKENYGDVE